MKKVTDGRRTDRRRTDAIFSFNNKTRNRQWRYGRIATTYYLKKYIGKPEIHEVNEPNKNNAYQLWSF